MLELFLCSILTILPESSGRLAETFVHINQRVKKGQPLFRLDSTQQEAAVEKTNAKAALKEAEVVLKKTLVVAGTDILIDLEQMGRPGSITVILQPLYRGQLDNLPLGGRDREGSPAWPPGHSFTATNEVIQ
jgi:hypothetical protein